MVFKSFCIYTVLIIGLYGCSAPVIQPVDPSLNNTNSSLMYLVRPVRFVNGGVTYRVFLNDKYIGPLVNGGTLTRKVSEGQKKIELKGYEFGIPSGGKKKLMLSVEEGYKYTLVMASNLGGITPIGGIVAVERTTDLSVTREPLINSD